MSQSELIEPRSEQLSILEFLSEVWSARIAVIFITLMVVICVAAVSLLTAKYLSQGFLQFGGPIPIVVSKLKLKENEKEPALGISLPDYKKYSAAFSTNERFLEYVKEKKFDSQVGINELRKKFNSREGISRVVEPIYPFTKFDAKELMEQPKDVSSNVIGLRVAFEGETPESAKQVTGILGRYVMDTIAYLNYSESLRFRQDELKTRLVKLENEIILNKTRLEEYQRRADDLKKIVAHNPSGAEQGGRQVVTVTEENARYLPPSTQLASTEVQITEANESILKARRDQQQSLLLAEYYERAQKLLDQTRSGETLLQEMEKIKESLFQTKDLQNDAVKEIYNQITVENQTGRNVYFEKSRFVAGPTLPDRSNIRWSLLLPISGILGLFLGLVYAFGRRATRLMRA